MVLQAVSRNDPAMTAAMSFFMRFSVVRKQGSRRRPPSCPTRTPHEIRPLRETLSVGAYALSARTDEPTRRCDAGERRPHRHREGGPHAPGRKGCGHREEEGGEPREAHYEAPRQPRQRVLPIE